MKDSLEMDIAIDRLRDQLHRARKLDAAAARRTIERKSSTLYWVRRSSELDDIRRFDNLVARR